METSLGPLTWENQDGIWTARIDYTVATAQPLPWNEFRKVWWTDRYLNGQHRFKLLDFEPRTQVSLDGRRFL